jgi:hypothetical protein
MRRFLAIACAAFAIIGSSSIGGVMLSSADARPAGIVNFYPPGVPPYPCTFERAGQEWCDESGALYQCYCWINSQGYIQCTWLQIN